MRKLGITVQPRAGRDPAPIWILVVALGGVALLLLAFVVPRGQRDVIPWWALAIGCAVAEFFIIRFPYRSESQSFSLTEVPLVIGLFFVSSQGLIAAQLVGTIPMVLLTRRQAPVKMVFNFLVWTIGLELAVTVFALAQGGPPLGPASWAAAILATMVKSIFELGAVAGAIYLSSGARPTRPSMAVAGFVLAGTVVNCCLALVAALLLRHEPLALILLAIPAAAVFLSYRQHEREGPLLHRALHDALTGLANRQLFAEHLSRVGPGGPKSAAVLLLDIDGFKEVNDTLGHAAGDELLVEIAGRLAGSIRRTDLAARLGGDEFAVLVTHRRAGTEALMAAERLLTTMETPVVISGGPMRLRVSIGIAVLEGDEQDPAVLLNRADLAMYAAKRGGGGRARFYEPEMDLTTDPDTAAAASEFRPPERRTSPSRVGRTT